jgi:hypothetical protein
VLLQELRLLYIRPVRLPLQVQLVLLEEQEEQVEMVVQVLHILEVLEEPELLVALEELDLLEDSLDLMLELLFLLMLEQEQLQLQVEPEELAEQEDLVEQRVLQEQTVPVVQQVLEELRTLLHLMLEVLLLIIQGLFKIRIQQML